MPRLNIRTGIVELIAEQDLRILADGTLDSEVEMLPLPDSLYMDDRSDIPKVKGRKLALHEIPDLFD